ncbi:MAG: hypothetical protein DLM55_00545 [Acidimicrobiales bacterium]|nr:MAG: hypothetical protein DLM55_00545 [Acidimicrobiales bacterium]
MLVVGWDRVPAVRTMLMLADREEISRGLVESVQYREIGLRIGRDCWVVSREVGRHGGSEEYRAVVAEQAASVARGRPKMFAVERSPRLCDGWSPASIAGRLPLFTRAIMLVGCLLRRSSGGLRPTGSHPGQGANQSADRA